MFNKVIEIIISIIIIVIIIIIIIRAIIIIIIIVNTGMFVEYEFYDSPKLSSYIYVRRSSAPIPM